MELRKTQATRTLRSKTPGQRNLDEGRGSIRGTRLGLSATRSRILLVVPSLIFVGVLILYPILDGFRLSLTDTSLMMPSVSFVGLRNFISLLHDDIFWLSLGHSSLLTAAAVILQYLLGLGLAIALNQRVPGIGFFRSLAMVTWVIPIAATVVLFKWMATPDYGFFNILLTKLGLASYTRYWFGSITWAMPMIILMHVWRNVPFYAIALLAAMKSIPKELYEAAEVDGAGSLQRFWFITLPAIRYTSVIMIVLHVIFTFNNFDFVYLSTGGGPVRATEVLPTYVYQQSWMYYALGYSASIGVIMMFLLIIFTIASLYYIEGRERS
ncbi:MAG TPA: sugar ABC transporter permease [Firmicutes bacterium]|nr:sugar ABC transporter permease [Bacillota bacterium]